MANPIRSLWRAAQTLNSSAYLLADEVIARLEAADPRLAEVFRDKVTLLDPEEDVTMLEGLLKLA
jgi:hypothetical protein